MRATRPHPRQPLPVGIGLLLAVGCGARQAPPAGVEADLAVPVPALVGDFADGPALVLEVMITNRGDTPLAVGPVTLDAPPFAAPPAECAIELVPDVDAETLEDLLELRSLFAADLARGTPCSIPPGRTGFVPLWAVAAPGRGPPARVSIAVPLGGPGEIETRVLDAPIETRPAPVLGPPLRGRFLVSNGLSADAGHRSMTLRIAGTPHWAQRFAADFVALDEAGCVVPEGATFDENTRYAGYGAEVLAVADARVARVIDGLPENAPGERAVPITTETVTGNAVWLALDEGLFAFYAHLVPGSIRVAEGDVVRRGEVLGRLGSSGNSTSPHLHFHVARGLGGLETEGMPYTFEAFDAARAEVPDALYDTERCVTVGPAAPRVRVMPARNDVISFE